MIEENYRKIIEKHIDIISSGLEKNPREIKRFLNNFIVAQEIFSEKGIKPKELLVLQILKMRWNEIYKMILTSNGAYLDKLDSYIKGDEEFKKLRSTKPEDIEAEPELGILLKLSTDKDFWKFLGENKDTMKQISDWNIYRRATRVVEEPIWVAYGFNVEVRGKIHDPDGNPAKGVRVYAYEHDPEFNADYLGQKITDSQGLFNITFDRSLYPIYSEHTQQGPNVFLIIDDPDKQFLSVHDRRNGMQTMYIKLVQEGKIAWKSNIMEIKSGSAEFDITIKYRK